jgi:hypothetical protein
MAIKEKHKEPLAAARTLSKLIQVHRIVDPGKAIREEAQLKYLSTFYEAMHATEGTR